MPNEVAHILCNEEIRVCLKMNGAPEQNSGQEEGSEMNERKEGRVEASSARKRKG